MTSSICIILTCRSPSLVSSVSSVKKNFPCYLVQHHTGVRIPSPAHPEKCLHLFGKGSVLGCFSLFIREIKVQSRLGTESQGPSESPVKLEFSEPPNFPLVWLQILGRKLFIPIRQGSVHHLFWFVLYPWDFSSSSSCTLGQQTGLTHSLALPRSQILRVTSRCFINVSIPKRACLRRAFPGATLARAPLLPSVRHTTGRVTVRLGDTGKTGPSLNTSSRRCPV